MTIIQLLSDSINQVIRALSATQQRQFACRIARRLLLAERAVGWNTPPASWSLIEVAEQLAVGQATHKEVYDAYQAHRSSGPRKYYCAISRVSYWCAYQASVMTADHLAYEASDPILERALQLADLLEQLAR